MASDAAYLRDEHGDKDIESLAVRGEETVGLAVFTDEAVATTEVNKGVGIGPTSLPSSLYQDIKDYYLAHVC